MKIAFISDIHGVPSTLSAALKVIDTLGYDKLVLLGDLLYHGPKGGSSRSFGYFDGTDFKHYTI